MSDEINIEKNNLSDLENAAESAAENAAENAAETVAGTAAENAAETAAETAAEASAETGVETAADIQTEENASASEEQSFHNFREFLNSLSEEAPDDTLRQADDADAVDAPETDEEPTPEEIKASLKKVKAEYKSLKAAQREAKERERERTGRSGRRVLLTVIISVLSSVICCMLLFVFMFLFPSRDTSLFATLAKKYAGTRTVYTNDTSSPSKVGDNEIAPGSEVTINVEGEFSAAAAYAKASESVVSIVTVRIGTGTDGKPTETPIAEGAGVVVSEDGEILTNHHVISSVIDTKTGGIAAGTKIYIYFDSPISRPYQAVSIVGYDQEFDLAVVKIERTGLKPIEFFDSDKLTVGESVIAIGSPGGLEFMGSVCDGIISGLKRTVVSSDSGATLYDMIQMTAPINPGNSGGAVVNSKGQLVGISVIKIVADNYESMAFAISSNTAARIIKSFRQYGRYVKPLLGVTINTLYGWRDADENGWPLGSLVVEVSEQSGAFKAGILPEDIIVEIGGSATPDYTSLRTNLLKYAPDDEVVFKVYRPSEDKYYEFTVKLTAA